MNKHFSKDNIWMAKKYMIRGSKSLTIREMQVKTKMTYHLTSVKWLSSKRQQIYASEDAEKR